MGIKGLQRYLSLSKAQTLHPYVRYRAKIFAIDANILIYKFCHAYPHSIGSFLECFVHKICAFLKFGIFPVFIFDGQAPLEKQDAILRRMTSKKQLRDRLERLKNMPVKNRAVTQHIQRLERQCFMVTKGHRTALVKLLDAIDVPYFVAEGEAETLCALFQRSGEVDYTLSDDTDTLAYGCSNIIQMFKSSERYLVETDLETFLKTKNLSRDEFLNVCVLSGCDYLDRASNVHIETCIEYVRKYHSLDQTLRELQKHTPMHELSEYERVKSMYQYQTDTTAVIMKQHQDNSGTIGAKLEIFMANVNASANTNNANISGTTTHKMPSSTLPSTSSVPDCTVLVQLFTDHAMSTFTINRLVNLIRDSVRSFSLVRHNFFSKTTNNKPK